MKTRFTINQLATAFAAVAMLGTTAGVVHADQWDGGGADDEFSTVENWEFDVFPTNDELISLLSDGHGVIGGVFTVERSVDSNIERSSINSGGVLNITGGAHSDSRAGNTIRTFVGTDGDGTINMSGGTYNIGHLLLIGNNGGNTGIVNVTAGDLAASRGGNSFIGIAGGSSIELGTNGGTGLLSLSGSSSLQTRIGVGVGATGVFEVIGSGHGALGIGIGVNGSLDGSWTQQAGGVLRVGLDSGGLTPINVVVTTMTGVGAGNVTFDAGAILDPFDAGSANNAVTTVMTWDGTLAGAPTLSSTAVSAGWEMQIVGNELQVFNSTLPPPAMGVLGDFNGDLAVDCADLDGYVGNIGAAATGALEALDIDGDGFLSLTDADTHIRTLVVTMPNGVTGTFPGDVNCDGSVTVLGDAFALVAGLNNPATSYAQGDLNFDGQVTVLGDAFILVANLNMSNQ